VLLVDFTAEHAENAEFLILLPFSALFAISAVKIGELQRHQH
jgi:hypothetical protein